MTHVSAHTAIAKPRRSRMNSFSMSAILDDRQNNDRLQL